MKIVIVGCGRVGASAADLYDRAGHEVIVLDSSTAAFDRLPSTFGGKAIRGDGTDEDVLRRAGAEGADVFLALTEGDNRNVMAAQLAAEVLGARRVIAKINDPLRATAYAELGIATVCRTGLIVDAIECLYRAAAVRASRPARRRPATTTPARRITSTHRSEPRRLGHAASAPTPVATREA